MHDSTFILQVGPQRQSSGHLGCSVYGVSVSLCLAVPWPTARSGLGPDGSNPVPLVYAYGTNMVSYRV
jgi:hypothetical protein